MKKILLLILVAITLTIKCNSYAHDPINPEEEFDITSPVDGQIYKIYVSKGQYVKKGEVLGEVEFTKTNVPIESDFTGVISSIPFQVGDEIFENENIFTISNRSSPIQLAENEVEDIPAEFTPAVPGKVAVSPDFISKSHSVSGGLNPGGEYNIEIIKPSFPEWTAEFFHKITAATPHLLKQPDIYAIGNFDYTLNGIGSYVPDVLIPVSMNNNIMKTASVKLGAAKGRIKNRNRSLSIQNSQVMSNSSVYEMLGLATIMLLSLFTLGFAYLLRRGLSLDMDGNIVTKVDQTPAEIDQVAVVFFRFPFPISL